MDTWQVRGNKEKTMGALPETRWCKYVCFGIELVPEDCLIVTPMFFLWNFAKFGVKNGITGIFASLQEMSPGDIKDKA